MKRLGYWLMLPLVGGSIVLCVLSWEWRDGLAYRHMAVEGARFLTARQVEELSAVKAGSPLFGLDLLVIRERLLSQPFVKSAVLNREYPGTLRVEVTERVPIATVNTGQLWYVDDEGTLLPYLQAPVRLDLPVISGLGQIRNPKTGQPVENADLTEAIHILQAAQSVDSSMYHFLSEVNMGNGGDVVLTSSEVGVPIYFGRGDAARKLVMLQAFWSEFVKSNNASRLRYLDLRYDDQVVVKWDNSDQHQGKAAL